MSTCIVCLIEKELTEFGKYKTGTYRKQCKKCRFEKNKEHKKQYNKTDKMKQYKKLYNTTDKHKEYHRNTKRNIKKQIKQKNIIKNIENVGLVN